jgi:hypothetical protein
MAKAYKSSLPYRKYVQKLVANLKEYFFLHDWKIKLVFVNPLDLYEDDEDTMASVYTDSGYLYAILRIFPAIEGIYEDEPIENFVQMIVHEFVHIQTTAVMDFAHSAGSEQTKPLITTEVERQTQRLSCIICQSLPKSVYRF